MVQDSLVQYLPSDLDNALQQTMVQGEMTLISLPGAIGEALAVTSKRIAVIRDKGPTAGIEVFSYPLVKVFGVTLGASTTGGTLIIETSEKADEEERTVYFASYDKAKYEAAVERIRGLISVASMANNGGRTASPVSAAENPGTPAAATVPQKIMCGSCGEEINERDIFCTACGDKLRDICQVCSGSMPQGAKYCPACGSEAKPAVLECHACGERVNSAVMSYCPQCGTSLTLKCVSCGGAIIPGWPRCRYCGREIGSDVMPGARIRMQHREAINQKSSAYVEEVREAHNEAIDEKEQSPAEIHNARGAEYFEKDMLDEAIEEFRKAVTLEPDNSYYHCNLAAAYDQAGQADDAIREYRRTLELNPKDITALLYLGYLLNEQDNDEEASNLWRKVIEYAPGTPEAEEAQQNLNAQESP